MKTQLKRNRILQAFLITGIAPFALATTHAEDPITTFEKPRLVLQITVDQMRGDFPMRYKDRLGEGGFRYLMEKGTHYINAHFQHADTETPIGHAALFTGTYPAHNGIVAGNWFDADTLRTSPPGPANASDGIISTQPRRRMRSHGRPHISPAVSVVQGLMRSVLSHSTHATKLSPLSHTSLPPDPPAAQSVPAAYS